MTDLLRLLVIDDHDDRVADMLAALTVGGFVPDALRVATPHALDEALRERTWDLVIGACQLDWPAGPGPLDLIHSSRLDPPIIAIADTPATDTVGLMRAGAHDVLYWHDLSRLPDAVRRVTRDARVRAERRRSEAALRQSEERHRRLFEESSDAIFVVDRRSRRFLDGNRAAARLTGRSLPDLRRLTVDDIVGPSSRDMMRDVRLTAPGHELGEVEFVCADGQLRTALLSLVEIDADVVYGIAHEITQRKHAEEALRRSEAELRSLFSAVPTGIAVVRDGVLVSANDRLCEMLGRTRLELEGQPSRVLYLDDGTYEAVRLDLARQVQETGRGVIETNWRRGDGTRIDVMLSCARLDPHGARAGITVAVLDITERKQAEDRLRRLAAAIEQSEEGVMITDPQGLIEYVNPAFSTITGYLPDDVLNQSTRLLRSGRQDPAFYAQLWSTVLTGRTWSGRLVNRRKDGSLYHQDCTITPVLSADGRIERFVAAMRDVTKSLQLEEELRHSQRVESLGRLAAVVAHDFNNLLSPILGYSELLLAELHPSDERHAQIREIESASRRARDLTRQLLAFGRKQTLQIRPVDLNVVAVGLERLMRRALREDIQLTVTGHHRPCVVMADRGQMEQVVMNLAVNAQDAMPDGGSLTVRIESLAMSDDDCAMRPGTSPGLYGVLIVADTGCGMTPEIRQRIFEPFFSTKGDRGTGLGLSTVYGIVKQHGGHVSVDSEPGRGSVFEVYLPATDAASDEEPAAAPVVARQRAHESVLLVEDNEAVRELAQTILLRDGYAVYAAGGGTEAMARLDDAGGRVDLLLTDVVMAGMDGHTLYEQVEQRCPGVKVLFMSGYTDDVVAERGVLDGGFAFVRKPFSVAALSRIVRDVLEGS